MNLFSIRVWKGGGFEEFTNLSADDVRHWWVCIRMGSGRVATAFSDRKPLVSSNTFWLDMHSAETLQQWLSENSAYRDVGCG